MRIFLICLIFFPFQIFATDSNSNANADTTKKLREDFAIVAMLDSLDNIKIFDFIQKERRPKSKFNFPADSVPDYSETVYASRIAKMDAKTPFKYDYNDAVKPYIDLYARRKREQVEKMLSLGELYFPLFEEKLAKYNLPLELKYLPVIESALNANAKSRAGAMGLWQFMYGTGKMFGLEINSYVDERCDPDKATEAACQYLAYLYNMYHDWQLVLAAYNAGPGNVNKAIRRSGGKTNYWSLRPFLPLETRGYVPAFIGASYVFSHTEEHNLKATQSILHFLQTDTINLKHPVSIDQLAQSLQLDADLIRFLNPGYKKGIIPCIEDKFNVICLPKAKVGDFINNEDQIYAFGKSPSDEGQEKMIVIAPATQVQEVRKSHTVKNGETLTTISKKYLCSVQEIRQWNNLKSNNLKSGQKLVVYVSQPTAKNTLVSPAAIAKPVSPAASGAANSEVKYVYYTVQAGDTLFKIANKYDGVSVDDIKKWNNLTDINSLKIGTKLKVAVAG
jgi:membrane-bound lytic murein transglycosylase D